MKIQIQNTCGGDKRNFRTLAGLAKALHTNQPYLGYEFVSAKNLDKNVSEKDIKKILRAPLSWQTLRTAAEYGEWAWAVIMDKEKNES